MTEDTLNRIGVLTRREVEARIVAPLLEAMMTEFGREQVLALTRQVIVAIAREQGAALAQQAGGCTLGHFAAALEPWKKGDDGQIIAMQIETLAQTESQLAFNVTRCRYAEMYRELGLPELGVILSCSRDFALIEGFNPDIHLTRSQTIMDGAPFCDFRYHQPGEPDGSKT